MNKHTDFNRRQFLKTGVVASLALSALRPTGVSAAVTKTPGEPFAGLKVGVASYSLRKFPLDKAIPMTKALGIKYITLKDFHLAMKSTPEARQAAAKAVADAGLVLMGGGVIYMKTPDEVKAAFDYARDAQMPTIVCSPNVEMLDEVEKAAKAYKIRIAIHNHGPGDKNYPSPLDVLKLIKDRDPLLGICIDVGHTVRINQDPIAVIKECAPRLYDFHIKDVNEATPKGGPVEVGRGVIDIVAVLKTLLEIKFSGHLALEYEIKENDPMPGMIESFSYIKGVLAAIR
jgi:sugar phosphate isomerase/epimerase